MTIASMIVAIARSIVSYSWEAISFINLSSISIRIVIRRMRICPSCSGIKLLCLLNNCNFLQSHRSTLIISIAFLPLLVSCPPILSISIKCISRLYKTEF